MGRPSRALGQTAIRQARPTPFDTATVRTEDSRSVRGFPTGSQPPRRSRSRSMRNSHRRSRRLLGALTLTLVAGFGGGTPIAQAQRPPGALAPLDHDSSDEQIRQTLNRVRAGRKLTPKSWPNGARVAVAFSFDIDNELLARANPLPVPLSQGEY